jgi:hypothetical protein
MRRPRCMLGLLLRATSCCCVPAFYAMHCAGMHALCMPYANMFARSALHAERQLGRNATTADATPRFHFAERRHFFFFPGVGRWRRSGTGEGSAWPRSSVCKDQEAGRHDAPGAWDTRAESEKNARNGHDRHILFGRVTGRRRSQLRCAFALRERKYWHHMACFSEAAPDHFRKLAASAAAQAQSSSGAGLCAA